MFSVSVKYVSLGLQNYVKKFGVTHSYYFIMRIFNYKTDGILTFNCVCLWLIWKAAEHLNIVGLPCHNWVQQQPLPFLLLFPGQTKGHRTTLMLWVCHRGLSRRWQTSDAEIVIISKSIFVSYVPELHIVFQTLQWFPQQHYPFVNISHWLILN